MSSPSSSSSGTGGRSPSRRPQPSRRRQAAAALSVAAALSAVAFAALESEAGAWLSALTAVVAVGTAARPLVGYLTGVVLSAGALAGAAILFLFTGCMSDNGRVDAWMWALGVAAIAGGWALALRAPRRLWWALPAATFAGFVLIDVLALAAHGSTGFCPD